MNKQTVRYIVIFSLLLIGSISICASCATPASQNSSNGMDAIDETMLKLETLYRSIEQNFLYDIDTEAVYDSMAKALFSALDDPYSLYTTAEESQALSDMTTGVYGGIGAYISKMDPSAKDPEDPETYMISIVSPFEGSPASKAGLHAGDLISHINGEPVDELTSQEASAHLRGQEGTVVKLTILRGSVEFVVEITRAIEEIPTVKYDMIPNSNIGYMRILEFTPQTGGKAAEAITDFVENGFGALILDLRGNPGGAVESALQIADMFLSDVTIIYMESKNPNDSIGFKARKQTVISSYVPIVVLIDGGSASSSEILAGALKDTGRAVLIGSTTYGKGLVQNVYPFGDDYYNLTVSKYLTPNRNDIHKIGIEPDIEVKEPELTDEEIESYISLLESRVISAFAEEHEEGDIEAEDAFIASLKDDGIVLGERYLRILIKREFQYQKDDPPVFDLEYDTVLIRALIYLKNGE